MTTPVKVKPKGLLYVQGFRYIMLTNLITIPPQPEAFIVTSRDYSTVYHDSESGKQEFLYRKPYIVRIKGDYLIEELLTKDIWLIEPFKTGEE